MISMRSGSDINVPNSKFQTLKKLQASISKIQTGEPLSSVAVEVSTLALLWCLELGVWGFSFQ
jgi:hypothetical protein